MPGLRFPARALNPVCRRTIDQAVGWPRQFARARHSRRLEAASAHTVPRVSSWFFGIDPGLARRRAGLGSPSLMEDRLSFIEAFLREFWFRRVLPPVPIGRLVIVKGSS